MANVSAPGEAVERLIQAVRQGRVDEIQILVESQPALVEARDVSGVSAILIALYHGHPDVARWLAARRANLDVFEASALGEVDRVEQLLSRDPSLAHATSPDGFTALALASFLGQLGAVRSLFARGADPNAIGRSPERYTALTGAVAARQADVVRELLQNGADVNYRYAGGLTPLHVASANGSVEIARMLMEAGADAGATNDAGKTPLDLAEEKGHREMIGLLAARR